MNLYVEIEGRKTLRGSYPDNNNPHIAAAANANAKSWLDGGHRVWFDDAEVLPPTRAHMADVAQQFEVVTTPAPTRRYATRERIAA